VRADDHPDAGVGLAGTVAKVGKRPMKEKVLATGGGAAVLR